MIVGISGGLGNSMFKYAFGISVAKARKEPVFFHKRFDPPYDTRHGRKFMLDVFNISGKFIDDPGDASGFDKGEGFNPDVYAMPAGLYYEGGWQSEKYFDRELVLEEFTLKNEIGEDAQKIAADIQSGPSTFIHVRRGDFLWTSESFQGVMPLEYYKKAMAHTQTRVDKTRFFVFSDDPEWCRGTFLGQDVVGTGLAHEDMFLMSLCDNAIMANSTFSWWGAWIGDQRIRYSKRIVIAPRQWYADTSKSTADLIPSRWVQL